MAWSWAIGGIKAPNTNWHSIINASNTWSWFTGQLINEMGTATTIAPITANMTNLLLFLNA